MNVNTLLDYMVWSETKALEPPRAGKKKVHLAFTLKPNYNEDGKLSFVEITYPDIRWQASSDHTGITIETPEGTQCFSWADLPKRLVLEMNQLHSALYLHRNDVIPFPIARTGPWSKLECPGWFGLTLYNSLLKAGCEQAM